MEAISSHHNTAIRNAQLQVLSGQQDLNHNLTRLSNSILDAQQINEMRTSLMMERLFREQQMAAQALANAIVSKSHDSMFAQITQLVSVASPQCSTKS
jgi:hypothetical protein